MPRFSALASAGIPSIPTEDIEVLNRRMRSLGQDRQCQSRLNDVCKRIRTKLGGHSYRVRISTKSEDFDAATLADILARADCELFIDDSGVLSAVWARWGSDKKNVLDFRKRGKIDNSPYNDIERRIGDEYSFDGLTLSVSELSSLDELRAPVDGTVFREESLRSEMHSWLGDIQGIHEEQARNLQDILAKYQGLKFETKERRVDFAKKVSRAVQLVGQRFVCPKCKDVALALTTSSKGSYQFSHLPVVGADGKKKQRGCGGGGNSVPLLLLAESGRKGSRK